MLRSLIAVLALGTVVSACEPKAHAKIERIEAFCGHGQTVSADVVEKALGQTENSGLQNSYYDEPGLRSELSRHHGFEAWLAPYRITLPYMARAIGYASEEIPIDAVVALAEPTGYDHRYIYLRAKLPLTYRARFAWYVFTTSYSGAICS